MKAFKSYLFILIILLLKFDLSGLADLDGQQQKFVLEAKQIIIPGYPDAFNPSILCWKDQFLVSFRARDPATNVATFVGFIWLDKNFTPKGSPQLLHIKKQTYIQDPRLIISDGRLYMVYSDLWKNSNRSIRRMCIAEIYQEGEGFFAKDPEFLLNFEGEREGLVEKNWVPFEYNNFLLLSYSIFPHKVLLPLFGENKALTVDFSEGMNPWQWGAIRGGTQALKVNNFYLGFFHSSTVMKSVQSKGKSMQHYFMGAYVFQSSPPFALTKISPEPIFHSQFYSGCPHKTWKPIRVIFPGGFIFDEQNIWIAYGRQDHEIWIVRLDKNGLLNSLVPIQ